MQGHSVKRIPISRILEAKQGRRQGFEGWSCQGGAKAGIRGVELPRRVEGRDSRDGAAKEGRMQGLEGWSCLGGAKAGTRGVKLPKRGEVRDSRGGGAKAVIQGWSHLGEGRRQ